MKETETVDRYVEILAAYFEKNPADLMKEYKWPRGKPVPFDQTFSRRQDWSKNFNSQTPMREDSAIKMVVEWGGIRRGSVDELKIMANETPEQLINRGFHRVASWSKVLVLHDPEKFLIYDARVAFAINVILYNSGSIDTFFPMPPSRNTHIVRASNSQIGIKLKSGKSKKIDGSDFYTAYQRMAKTVAEKMGCPAWQIEMALFARGPELAKLAI